MDRCHWIQFHWRKTKLQGNCKLLFVLSDSSEHIFGDLVEIVGFCWVYYCCVYVGISKVCGNKVRRSILIGCWKKAAITADFKNFSVCPILNWMDVSRNLDLHQIFVFAGLDDKTAGLLEDCVLSVMRTWSLKLQRGCKMLSFEFSRLAGVSNSKGFSVSQVLAMRLGPNGRQNGSFERIKLA